MYCHSVYVPLAKALAYLYMQAYIGKIINYVQCSDYTSKESGTKENV